MATEKQIKNAAKRTDKWLKARQKAHIRRIEKSVQHLQDNILNSLNVIKVDPLGNIRGVKVNFRNAQKLHERIEQLFGKDYNTEAKKIVKDFENTEPLIKAAFADVDEAVHFTNIDKGTMNVLRDGYYQNYLNISATKKEEIVQAMYNQVIGAGRFSALVTSIRGALKGSKSVTGRPLIQYSRLYARDFIMNFHNEVNIKKAEDIGITHYLYTGTLMSKSRDFCKRRVGKIYTKNQINSWKHKWAGKSGPAFTHRGGYNCRHHWQPVRKEWFNE